MTGAHVAALGPTDKKVLWQHDDRLAHKCKKKCALENRRGRPIRPYLIGEATPINRATRKPRLKIHSTYR
jgi:hypothetical protein